MRPLALPGLAAGGLPVEQGSGMRPTLIGDLHTSGVAKFAQFLTASTRLRSASIRLAM
jgi:hypothetical protein